MTVHILKYFNSPMLRCIFTVLTTSVDNKVVIIVGLFHFSYDLRFQVAQCHVSLYGCGSINIMIKHLVL